MNADRLDRALGRLDALVDWERRDRSDMLRTLEPVTDVLERLGRPQEAWRSVLVAGTKGKGTVSALVGAALTGAGLTTGVYASPHVEAVTERVRVDGEQVPREELAAGLEAALDAREAALAEGTPGGAATWFDLMTAAAFVIFRERGVDWAVVEVGIGGRLDSTRAVDPLVSVVTTVGLEHTATLGPTRAAIAAEKGAVVAPAGVLVTGIAPEDGEVFPVLERLCREAGARLVPVPQRGPVEARNRALAEAVLNELGGRGATDAGGRPLWRSHLDAAAVEAARLPARAERFRVGGVQVVLDAGHVAESATLLLDELERDPELGRRPKLVLALGREKDAEGILKAFRDRVDRVLCTSAPEGRLLEADELAELADRAGLEPEAWDDPLEALSDAVGDAREGGGWVLVFGSFYLAGALRGELAEAHRAS